MGAFAKQKAGKRGVFLTLDASISMLIIFLSVVVAYSYYGNPVDSGFESRLLRAYMQDAATVMAKQGHLSAPMVSAGNSNTSGIRQVLRAIPASVCMQVSGYGSKVTDGLVAYWKLNEDSGTTVADSSQNGLNGRIYGNPSFLENGKAGRALQFGPSDYVEVDHSPLLEPGSFTVSAWMLLQGAPGSSQYAILLPNGYSLGEDEIGPVFSIGSGEKLYHAQGASRGAWHHLLGTYNAAKKNMTFYFDGQVAESVSGVPAPPYSQSALTIASGMQQGALDDMRIYDRALAASEVRQLYSNSENLIYVVGKQGCAYNGGEMQSLTMPFAYNGGQVRNDYYYAVLRAWYRGAT